MNGHDALEQAELTSVVQLHTRVADVIQRFQKVAEDALSIAVDLHKYGETLEADLPPSEARDRLIAETAKLEQNLISLASPRKTEASLIEVVRQ